MKNIIKRIHLLYLQKTNSVKWARKLGVKVGENCRFLSVTFSSEPYLIEIGNHVSATKVHFETHDGGVWVFRDKKPDWDVIKKTKIGNNVFIGYGTIIMPGVEVGNNIVIGANSIVTRNLESNFVYAGIPARKIKTIEEYYEKCSEVAIDTKQLSEIDKKFFLIDYFKKVQTG
jgi:acetyltransferase-like isoleucine patch superfamily enzyme